MSVVFIPTPPSHMFSFVPMATNVIGVPSIFKADFSVYPALVNISRISGYSIIADCVGAGAGAGDGAVIFICGGGGVCGNVPNGIFNRGGRVTEGVVTGRASIFGVDCGNGVGAIGAIVFGCGNGVGVIGATGAAEGV